MGSKDKQVLRAVEHVSPGVGHERIWEYPRLYHGMWEVYMLHVMSWSEDHMRCMCCQREDVPLIMKR